MRSSTEQRNGTKGALAPLVAKRRWGATDAERMLAAWRASGQSVAAFARQHGLSSVRLLRWRAQLEHRAVPVFHPVQVVQGAQAAAMATTAGLDLEVRGGRRIRVYAGFDPVLLEELVRTVEGFAC